MILPRTIPLLLSLVLCACAREPAPQAPPGAVERTTAALDRNAAAERSETTARNDAEAKGRADESARRIREIDQRSGKAR